MVGSFLKTIAVCLLAVDLSTVAAWGPDECCDSPSNADKCLRAVRASHGFHDFYDFHHGPDPSSASADCSSFLQRTVTPCVVSSYTTQTVTITAAPVTVTNTITASSITSITSTDSVVSTITTIDLTATSFTSSEVDVTQTSYSTVVSSILPAKRDAAYKAPLAAPFANVTSAMLRGRAPRVARFTSANTCVPSTASASSVPTYASACSGAVRYSSACSCNGIRAATTTLTAKTTMITDMSTTTVTPTVFATSVLTQIISETATVTQIIPTSFSTTDTTVVINQPYTVTSQLTLPTTVGVNYCRSFMLVATDGNYPGYYVTASVPTESIGYGNPELVQDASQAMYYVLGSDGRLYGNNVYQVDTTTNPAFNYLQQMNAQSTQYYESQYGYSPLHCTVATAGVNVVGDSAGALSCTLQGSAIYLETCTQVDYPNLLISGPYVSTGYGCKDTKLQAVFNGFVQC